MLQGVISEITGAKLQVIMKMPPQGYTGFVFKEVGLLLCSASGCFFGFFVRSRDSFRRELSKEVPDPLLEYGVVF